MTIKISLKNSEVGGSARFLNNTDINNKGDITIDIDKMKIHHELEMLNSTEIDDLMYKIRKAVESMDSKSSEYKELCNILNKKTKDKCIEKITNHLGNFATGALANIVSEYLTRHI